MLRIGKIILQYIFFLKSKKQKKSINTGHSFHSHLCVVASPEKKPICPMCIFTKQDMMKLLCDLISLKNKKAISWQLEALDTNISPQQEETLIGSKNTVVITYTTFYHFVIRSLNCAH